MTWDLSVIYDGFASPAFQEDLHGIQPVLDRLSQTLQKGGEPLPLLEKTVRQLTALTEKVSKLATYTYLVWAADAVNQEAAAYLDQLMAKNVNAQQIISDLSRYLGGVEDLDAVIAKSPLLTEQGFILRELKENASHRMDKAIESWVLRMSLTGGETFAQLREKLAATLTANFRGEELPLSAVRAKAYDPDPAVRKDAYEAELAAYPKAELALAACLSGIKGEARIHAEARHFDSVLDWTLHESRMDKETLDALWTAVKEALPNFRRYLRAKGKLLGHPNGIPFCDIMAPVGKGLRTYTPEEAEAILAEKLGTFSPRHGRFYP